MDEKGVFPKLLVKFNLGVFSVGQGAKNIEFLVISHSLRTMPVPNLVPEFKII